MRLTGFERDWEKALLAMVKSQNGTGQLAEVTAHIVIFVRNLQFGGVFHPGSRLCFSSTRLFGTGRFPEQLTLSPYVPYGDTPVLLRNTGRFP